MPVRGKAGDGASQTAPAFFIVTIHADLAEWLCGELPDVLYCALPAIPLARGNEPILRNYCAFWQKKNGNPYVAEFAELLKKQFQDGAQRG